MKIKEAARATGLTEKTIRYYESRGLVVPAARELNGRSFRDYSEADVEALRTVATLRRARFSVEQIARMREDPDCIPDVVRGYAKNVEEAHAVLGRLLELLEREDLTDAADAEELAARLRPATETIPLPKQDLRFHFRLLDERDAQTRRRVRELPDGLRFGWMTLYSGKDRARFEDMQVSLRLAGIPFRTRTYTATERLSAQGLANMGSSMANFRGPTVTNFGLQAKLLSDERLDSYGIEIRKRDAARAREALRSLH